jgi:16S rRNA (cytosine967-C5)-methyltransferase
MALDAAREIALKILYDINEEGAYSNIAVNKYLEGYEIRAIDRSFITDLVYGSIKHRLTIDWIIEQFSSIKFKKISPWILNILRLGVYQLLFTDKIPESAAVNESVNLSKRFGHAGSRGYVNGILRNIARKKNEIQYPDRNIQPVKYLSVKYSHPEWMVDLWVRRYGMDFSESLLASNNEVPDFSIRINTLRISKDGLIKALKDEGLEASSGKYVEEALVIKNPTAISKSEAFKKGLFQIQDESPMLVGKILDPKPGQLIIDVCSAPGGKSTHIAQLMDDVGTVISRDVHEHKIKLIEDAVKRLGLTIIKTELFDALKVDSNYIEKADAVLVDAPCTGLGIIRRKPDIKWTRQIGDREEISELQKKIITSASCYVKPGGVLVYSTCTIEPEENEDIIRWFLEENNDFYCIDVAPLLPEKLAVYADKRGYIKVFPNRDGIDGFFISKLKKRG